MNRTTFRQGLGGVAGRASITIAASAVLMAGLHYAPLRGFSPGKILLGHESETAAIQRPQPNIRFVAIPARDAFPPAAAAAAVAPAVESPSTALPTEPAAATVIPTPRPAFVAATVRPRTPATATPPTTLARTATPSTAVPDRQAAVPGDAATPLRQHRLPADDALMVSAGSAPELQRTENPVPYPAAPEDRSFELADLVPSDTGVLNGVISVGRTVGDGAIFAVNGITDGALAIVGH